MKGDTPMIMWLSLATPDQRTVYSSCWHAFWWRSSQVWAALRPLFLAQRRWTNLAILGIWGYPVLFLCLGIIVSSYFLRVDGPNSHLLMRGNWMLLEALSLELDFQVPHFLDLPKISLWYLYSGPCKCIQKSQIKFHLLFLFPVKSFQVEQKAL